MVNEIEEKCPKCGIPLNVRIVLHNIPENCKEYITYPYMKIGESMHMDCYIHHVMDMYFKKNDKSFNMSTPYCEGTENLKNDKTTSGDL